MKSELNSSIINVLLLVVSIIPTFGQDYTAIEKALSTGDIQTLMKYAPDQNFGPISFSTLEYSIELKKEELPDHLTKYFQSLAEYKYVQLFADKVNYYPLVVGKFVSSERLEYLMIGMSKIEGEYRFMSFNIMKELPANMKVLDN